MSDAPQPPAGQPAPVAAPAVAGPVLFPAPSPDEVVAFLKAKTPWVPLPTEPVAYNGPAVYLVRQKGAKPVLRWLTEDKCGLLYLGSSKQGKAGLSTRTMQMANGTHGVKVRLDTLRRQCEALGGQVIESEFSYVELADEQRAVFWESYLLLSYYYFFGDRPPLNRKLEYRYLRHGNVGDAIVRWPTIRDVLLAIG